MTVDDTTSGTGEEPPPEPSVHATPHHEVDHTAEPTDDPLAIRLEQLILGAERRYTPFQAARTAGVSMDLASRFWRAMGFADIGQAKALTEADVLALRRLAGLVEAGLLSEPMAVQVARSTGQTTARLAEWQIDSFLEGLTEPPEPGMTRTEVTYPLVELLLPELEEFLIYVWRRQLAAATGRVVQAADDDEMVDRRLAVGFADLVGFTRLTHAAGGGGARRARRGVRDDLRRPGRRARRPAHQDPRRRGSLRRRRRGHGCRDRVAPDRGDDPGRDDARSAGRYRVRHGHDPDGRCLRYDGEPRQPASRR